MHAEKEKQRFGSDLFHRKDAEVAKVLLCDFLSGLCAFAVIFFRSRGHNGHKDFNPQEINKDSAQRK